MIPLHIRIAARWIKPGWLRRKHTRSLWGCWHWADKWLVSRGYAINSQGKLWRTNYYK